MLPLAKGFNLFSLANTASVHERSAHLKVEVIMFTLRIYVGYIFSSKFSCTMLKRKDYFLDMLLILHQLCLIRTESILFLYSRFINDFQNNVLFVETSCLATNNIFKLCFRKC